MLLLLVFVVVAAAIGGGLLVYHLEASPSTPSGSGTPGPSRPSQWNISFDTSPSSCAPITFQGTTFGNSGLTTVENGSYSMSIAGCSGYWFSSWSATGGLSVVSPTSMTTQLVVAGPGAVTATFVPVVPASFEVSVTVAPSSGGSVSISGITYFNGGVAHLPAGTYSIVATANTSFAPGTLVSSGGVSISGLTLTVSGNGTVTASFSALYALSFVVQPASCGPITFGGISQSSGSGATETAGSYLIQAPSCSGYIFGSWSTSSGLSVSDPSLASTSATVSSSGSLTATYNLAGAPRFTVNFTVSPSGCGPLTFNGSTQPSGSSGTYPAGAYAAVAPFCSGYSFYSWSSSGGVTVTSTGSPSTTVSVVSGGGLTATFSPNGCGGRTPCYRGALLYEPGGANYSSSQLPGSGVLVDLNGSVQHVLLGSSLPRSRPAAIEGSFVLKTDPAYPSYFDLGWYSQASPSTLPSPQGSVNTTINSVGVAMTNLGVARANLTFGASEQLSSPLLYLAFGTYPTFFSNVTFQGVALNFTTLINVLNVNFPWLNSSLLGVFPSLGGLSTTVVVVVNNTIWLPNSTYLWGQAQLAITPQQVQAFLSSLNSSAGSAGASASTLSWFLSNLSEELIAVATPTWHDVQYTFLLAPLQLAPSLLRGNFSLYVENSWLGVRLSPGTNPNASFRGSMVHSVVGVTWNQAPLSSSGYNASTVPGLWGVRTNEPVNLTVPATGINLANLNYSLQGMGWSNSQMIGAIAALDNPGVFVMEDSGILTNINVSAPYRSFALAIIPNDVFANQGVTQYLNLSGVAYNVSYYLGACAGTHYQSCPVFIANPLGIGPASATKLLPDQLTGLTRPTFVNTTGFAVGTTLKTVNQAFGGLSEVVSESPIDVGLYDLGYSSGLAGYNLPAVRFTWGVGQTLNVTNTITEGLYVPASWVLSDRPFLTYLEDYLGIALPSGSFLNSLLSYINYSRAFGSGGLTNGSVLVRGVLFMMDLWGNSTPGSPLLNLDGAYTSAYTSCPSDLTFQSCLTGNISASANSASYLWPSPTVADSSLNGGSTTYTRNCVYRAFGCTWPSYFGHVDCFPRIDYCSFSPYHVVNVTAYSCYGYRIVPTCSWGYYGVTRGATYAVSYNITVGGAVFAATQSLNVVFN